MAAAAAFGCAPEPVMPACVAIELLHNYSLIHDDIEDGDRLRHGREALWTSFGLPHGINAGDAVGALAQYALAPASELLGFEVAFDMSMELAAANMRMCEGQALDLALESGSHASIADYLEMIEGKTSAVFSCSAALGALGARAARAEVERTRKIGKFFGLGFQIRDDILGIWADSAHTGKVAAGDLARRKKTYPIVWAMETDPHNAGRIIMEAYSGSAKMTEDVVERLRAALDGAGAYAAARLAADNYFESAVELAQGRSPLSDFVLQNRT
jgi:geranylgeranyl diphosphate synthase type I